MTSRHVHEHDTLLQAAVTGEIGSDEPRLRAVLERCAECRDRMNGLAQVRQLLDATATDEWRVLAELDWQADVPGRAMVHGVVRDGMRELQAELRLARRPWWQRPWIAAAAAGVLVAGWLARLLLPPSGDPTNDEVMLGANVEERLTPSGAVSEYSPFQWRMTLPRGGHFELRVWDAGPGASAEPIAQLLDLDEQGTIFPSEQTAEWPNRIRWEVRAYDAFGSFRDGREAFAER